MFSSAGVASCAGAFFLLCTDFPSVFCAMTIQLVCNIVSLLCECVCFSHSLLACACYTSASPRGVFIVRSSSWLSRVFNQNVSARAERLGFCFSLHSSEECKRASEQHAAASFAGCAHPLSHTSAWWIKLEQKVESHYIICLAYFHHMQIWMRWNNSRILETWKYNEETFPWIQISCRFEWKFVICKEISALI